MLFNIEEITFNSYKRPGKTFKQPRIFIKYVSAADSLLSACVPFQPVYCQSVFKWWFIGFEVDVFDFSTSVASWMYRLMKVSAENTCCSSFCKRKLTRRLLATQPPCSIQTSSAEMVKMALLSYASGPSLWKKWGSISVMWTGYTCPSCLILFINSEKC